jgi:hypothetical protein
LSPQHLALPLESRTQLWNAPAATATTFDSLQSGSQPSEATVLPSSHSSPMLDSTFVSPHLAVWHVLLEQTPTQAVGVVAVRSALQVCWVLPSLQ